MARRSRPDGWRYGLQLSVVVYSLSATVGAVEAQSLGELARREEARRAALPTSSRVYSNRASTDREKVTMPPLQPSAASPPTALPLPGLVAAPSASSVKSPLPDAAAPTAEAPAVSTPAASRSSGVASREPSLVGWSPFQIRKTAAEMTETNRLADGPELATRTRPSDVRMPPQFQVMRVATGIGYLQGADLGLDLTGAGKINGLQTEVAAFVTAGPLGLQSRSARFSMFSADDRWRAEGGDLYSDLGGLARGARISWSAGSKWTPSFSLYLPRAVSGSNGSTAVAYRDRYQLHPRVRLGGELTSEGATFVQGQYADPRIDLTVFSRFTRGLFAGHDQGVSGGVSVGRGVALSGALRLSDAVDDSTHWQFASLRLPLPQQASITLERSWWTGSSDDGATNAVVIQLLLGKVRLMQRLQWGRTDYRSRAVPFGFDRRQSLSTASYTPAPWGTLNYQQSTQWFDDGRVQQWDEVSSMFQLGRTTSVQLVTAFPDMWEPRRLRARVRQQLSETLLLEAQYGRLSAFQLTPASGSEASRVMVTIRKTWQIRTPSRGGDVRGRTIDQAGHPVAGALVRLGPYTAVTDAEGQYGFTRVPDGEFELALDRNKLPVAYAWDEKPRALSVTRSSRVNSDLEVIPLNAIRGRVYIDRNVNGQYDEDEGVPNAVVSIGGSVTATTVTGTYAFYNQSPGRYTVGLDVKRLPKGLAAASAAERDIELTGAQPVVGIDFKVEKRDMPILMRETGR